MNRHPLLGSVLCAGALYLLLFTGNQLSLPVGLLAPIGASCFLVFCMPPAPLSSPRALIGGHLACAAIGAACGSILPDTMAGAATAVGLGALLMQATRTVHPPAAATAAAVCLSGAAFTVLWTLVLPATSAIALAAWLRDWLAERIKATPR